METSLADRTELGADAHVVYDQRAEVPPQSASRPAQRNVVLDAALGALAGAAGVWVMDKIGWSMYGREDDDARRQEHEARVHGKDPAHVAVEKVAEMTGAPLPTEEPNPAGVAVHYGLGMIPGAMYGAARHEFPALRTGSGALYGMGLFLTQDEVTAPLLGLASPPGDYPVEAHVRGLVSHVALGVVTETVLGLTDRVRSHGG
ncbi:MAG: DUF1440 domain-containing protein [Actinomycetota bacterium]|nr:DUF1440 domain-containing protein [Actinomycetota bacterium]